MASSGPKARRQQYLVGWCALLLTAGCQAIEKHAPPRSDLPHELNQVSLPTYVIESPDVLLSDAVAWEVAVKRSTGTLEAPVGFAAILIGAGANALAVTIAHVEAAGLLAWHHRDPFDRMLVAQATVEQAVLVSDDAALVPYGVPLAW